MQKKIVLVLALMAMAGIAAFVQDITTATNNDALCAGVEGNI